MMVCPLWRKKDNSDTAIATAAGGTTEEEEGEIAAKNGVSFQEDIVTDILSHLELSDIGRCSEVCQRHSCGRYLD